MYTVASNVLSKQAAVSNPRRFLCVFLDFIEECRVREHSALFGIVRALRAQKYLISNFLGRKTMQPEESAAAEIIDAELVDAELVGEELNTGAKTSASTNKGILEQLLSEQSLKWMMCCGCGFLVLGFVIWLWSAGIFENPIIIATTVSAATLGTLAAGIGLVRSTRYQLAGKGLAMLGSLAMPLNLWLYDAQGLITLADGGHLWIPAAICCLIYAVVARVLRDATFVYALVGGIVMTGMLFLADASVNHFWALMPQVTFLVATGWICTFAERLFIDDDGDFSRKRFGSAFKTAGLIVVGSGLAMLSAGYGTAIVNQVLFNQLWPLLASSQPHKLWGLGVVGVSAAGFAAMGVIHRSESHFRAAALAAVLMVPITIDFLAIKVTVTHVAILFASLIAVTNLFFLRLRRTGSSSDGFRKESNFSFQTRRSIHNLSLIGASVLSVLAILQFVVQFMPESARWFLNPLGIESTIQILITGIAAVTFSWNCEKGKGSDYEQEADATGLVAMAVGAGLVVAAAWTGCFVQSILPGQIFSVIVGSLTLAISLAALLTNRTGKTDSIVFAATFAAATHLILFTSFALNGLLSLSHPHLYWIANLLITATVFLANSFSTRNAVGRDVQRGLACLSATAAVATAGHWIGFDFGYCLILAPMLVGTSMKIAVAFVRANHKLVKSDTATQVSLFAKYLVMGSGVAGTLFTMSRWLESETSVELMLLVATQLVCVAVVSFLSKSQAWRFAFRGLIVATIASGFCVFDGWLQIDGWHRAELFCLIAGLIAIVLGHVAWFREDDQKDEVVGFSLLSGSLLLILPLTIGLLFYRLESGSDPVWQTFHELTAIATGLLLLGSGLMCKLRSTTIAGAALLGVYILSLLTLIRLPSQLQSVSVVMMVGGALFFGTALLMSVYRDRIVSLPRRIREGEGVYRVLKWR
jgi:hypothetical protein